METRLDNIFKTPKTLSKTIFESHYRVLYDALTKVSWKRPIFFNGFCILNVYYFTRNLPKVVKLHFLESAPECAKN